jgi:cytochrome c biogenesis protein CcdA
MTTALVVSLVGIAALDSLNPSLFIAQFFLFTTPQPVRRLFSYIAGILVVNFFGGVLILAGMRTLVTTLLIGLDNTVVHALQWVVGLALVAFGLWFNTEGRADAAHKPRSLGLAHAFLLGMVVMLNEITTALPYFVAIERISEARLSLGGKLAALLLYNLVFSLPLFAFVGLFVRLRGYFTAQLARITAWIQVWMPRLVKVTALVFGVILLVNASLYFLGKL